MVVRRYRLLAGRFGVQRNRGRRRAAAAGRAWTSGSSAHALRRRRAQAAAAWAADTTAARRFSACWLWSSPEEPEEWVSIVI